jgi:hypothetical protein
MAPPILIHEVRLTRAGSERRRRRLLQRGVGWALWLLALSALFWLPHAATVVSVTLLGPWLAAIMEWTKGRYVFSVAYGLLGIATALILPAAWMLTAPKKATVLFLRRFRLEAVSTSMSHAVEHGIGRHIRIVTLDDRSFRSLEAPPVVRKFSRWTAPTVLTVFALIVVAGLVLGAWLFLRYSFSMNGLGVIGMLIVRMTLVLTLPLIAVLCPYLATQFGILLALRRRVRQRAKILVVNPEHLENLENRVRILSNRWRGATILEPQATVVEVSDELWKDAVRVGLKQSDYILVDVSPATENLLWELEGVLRENSYRVLFTAEENLFANWTCSPSASPTEARAYALLAGQEVLGYAGDRRLDRKRYRRSLIRSIDNMFLEPSQHLRTKDGNFDSLG